LDLMILEVFSNLNDPMMLCRPAYTTSAVSDQLFFPRAVPSSSQMVLCIWGCTKCRVDLVM